MSSKSGSVHLRRRASDAPLARLLPLAREPAIEWAIADDRVDISFQPMFDLENDRIVRAEALARVDGFEGAAGLFARARNAGLAERLSRHVQRKSLRAAAGWTGALKGLPLSINLLPEDAEREGIDQWLLDELSSAGLDPARLTVEITEDALMADPRRVGERLGRLRDAGVTIALDDFGIGYASMANLSVLPLDILKIDRGMIAGIEHCDRQQVVVRNVLVMARELGLAAVVEGVETAGQLLLLRSWGCTYYQGFLGSAALGERSLARFVAQSRQN
jgi:EAL domain-containing protein (putative c-di-GMP-specific phosphodiesterase class I)